MLLRNSRGQLMRKVLLSLAIVFMWCGIAMGSGNTGDYVQVGDGYLGTAAILDKADAVANDNTLPTGAAIIAWGGGGGTGYWTQTVDDIYYTTGSVAIGIIPVAGNTLYVYDDPAIVDQKVLYVFNDGSSAGAGYAGYFQADGNVANYGVYSTVSGGTYNYPGIFLGGNVGIGDTSPDTALDVVGVITATGGTSTNWNTAYTDRLKWDGGNTDLVPATGITSLGLDVSASALTSGAYQIGVYDEFTFSDSTTVQEVLADFDFAISIPAVVSDVRLNRSRFNSTTGRTVIFDLPALNNADYNVITTNFGQDVNSGEISVEDKATTGFTLKCSGSDTSHFFEYFAIPYEYRGETMQEGTDTFNSTAGVTVAMAPDQDDTDYNVIISMPAQTNIEDIGAISIENKLVGSFDVMNSGDDAVTTFNWMVVPYTVGGEADPEGSDNFAGSGGVEVAIGEDVGSTAYVVLITVGTQVGIEDIGVVSIATKTQTTFVVKNSGAGVTAFDWRIFAGTPGTADMYRGTYDADYNAMIDMAAGGFNSDVSAFDGLVKITGGVASAITDSSTDWDTAYTHSQAVTGAEHGAVVANTANMIVRRGASGEFSAGVITASLTGNLTGNVVGNVVGGVTGDVTGNADTATALETARDIGGVSFDGTASIVPLTIVTRDESTDTTCFVGYFNAAVGTDQPNTGTNLTFNSSSGVLTATGFIGNVTGDLTGDVTGNVTGSSTSCSGNAATATALANARYIGGVLFNGTANIVPATMTVINEPTDTENFIAFFDDATGTEQARTNAALTFNAATGVVTATGFAGPLTGAVTGNATTASHASDLAIGSEAQGDVLYFDGSNWVRLAAGTAEKFLKTQGAGANPMWDTPVGTGDITSVWPVATGSGLTGGASSGAVTLGVAAAGGLTVHVPTNTVQVASGGIGTTQLADIAFSVGSPGAYTNTNLTVDADGRITAVANGSSGGVSAGYGINIIGDEVSVKNYGSTLTSNANGLYVSTGGIGATQLASSGVEFGTYANPVNLIVDVDGRITSVDNNIPGIDPTDISVAGYSRVFNADHHGTHGTQAAIVAAIAAAKVAGGGVVYLSQGTWTLSSQITISSPNIHIMGAGTGTTTVSRTGGSGSIFHFNAGSGSTATVLCGVSNMTFSASTSQVAVYLADGNYPYTSGGGAYGRFEHLHFSTSITTGLRIGLFAGWGIANDLTSSYTGLSRIVWFDTAAADTNDDNPTGWMVSNINGEVTSAGVYCSGNAFGDLVITNVNTYGRSASACGVRLVGSAYGYKSHITITGVHMDGSGSHAVYGTNIDGVVATGITYGGDIGAGVYLTGSSYGWVDQDNALTSGNLYSQGIVPGFVLHDNPNSRQTASLYYDDIWQIQKRNGAGSWIGTLMALYMDTGNLWVEGYNISNGWILGSPVYKGDNALDKLQAIQAEPGSVDSNGWGDVDHSTLPKGIKVKVKKPKKRSPNKSEEMDGMDIGRLLNVAVKAIVELKERIEVLENQ